jgi:hypothetical protein
MTKSKKPSAASTLFGKIDQWHKSVLSTQTEGHLLAVECLKHAAEHGDVTVLERLVNGLRNRGDGKAHVYVTGLTAWIRTFSPIMVKKDGNWGLRSKDSPDYKAFDVVSAEKTPFWTLGPVGIDKLLDAAGVRTSLANELKKVERSLAGEGKTWDEQSPFNAAQVAAALKTAIYAFDAALKANPAANSVTVEEVAQVETLAPLAAVA